MTYMADKYKTLAEKLGDVARRLCSNGHIDDSSTVLEARDALLKIYKNTEEDEKQDTFYQMEDGDDAEDEEEWCDENCSECEYKTLCSESPFKKIKLS